MVYVFIKLIFITTISRKFLKSRSGVCSYKFIPGIQDNYKQKTVFFKVLFLFLRDF